MRWTAKAQVGLFALASGCAHPVFVVRHTEKQLDQGDDPDLDEAGRERARALADALPRRVDSILVTRWRRTWQTAAPTAARSSAPVRELDADDFEGIVAEAEAAGGPVLIVGHSNTLPSILAALGVENPPAMDELGYGELYVVRRRGRHARVQVRHFGDDPSRDPGH